VADLCAAFPVTTALESKAREDSAKAEATPEADAIVAVIDAAKPKKRSRSSPSKSQ